MKLSPETVLRRAHGVRVDLGTGGEVRITSRGGVARGGPHALAVLDAFATPLSFEGALARLAPRVTGAEDSIELTRTILQLADAGVLVAEGGGDAHAPEAAGFDAPTAHVLMLDDHARTSAFLRAIASVVKPGDVVIDVGTGTGILAVAAAKAGAKHVYAIEARGIARTAREVFAANGVADRVTLIEGWSTQIDVPERADVIVAEILGDELLSERAVESMRDAIARLAKPGARVIPESARLFALPLTLPDEVLRRRVPTAAAVAEWQKAYGVDLAALTGASRRASTPFFENPHECRAWPSPCGAADLGVVAFRTAQTSAIDRTARVTATAAGRIDAVLVYPEVQITNDVTAVTLSLAPNAATAENHWRSPLWILGEPVAVSPGDELAITYRYGAPGAGVEVSRR